MTTPDTTGVGGRKVTPLCSQPGDRRSVEPEKNARRIVSDMENETGAIKNLSFAVIAASSGLSEIDPADGQAALIRLGWLIVEACETLEEKRANAFHTLFEEARS